MPAVDNVSCVFVLSPKYKNPGIATLANFNGNSLVQDNNVLKTSPSDSSQLMEVQSADKVTPNESFIFEVMASKSTQQTMFVNGIFRSSVTPRNVGISAGSWYIGGGDNLGTNPYNGVIKEIIVYNRVLTLIERTQLEDYLRQKWQILNNTYVDFSGTKDVESGTTIYPYNKVKEGVDSVQTTGTVYITTAGSDLGPMSITKNVKIRALNGPVRIGH
jgi:hypothetical protein